MKFTQAELTFIREKLGINAEQDETREDILARIQDEAFEIEIEESNRLDELTDAGKLAADLVTRLGEE